MSSTITRSLTLKLPDAVVHLARYKREWHDTRDVHLWAKDMHVQPKLLTNILHVLETFLVVRSCTSNPDLDFVLIEERRDLANGTNDTLECACNLADC